jgi:hypothetical protein
MKNVVNLSGQFCSSAVVRSAPQRLSVNVFPLVDGAAPQKLIITIFTLFCRLANVII